MKWNTIATETQIAKTAEALKEHGFDCVTVETGKDAKAYILKLIPEHAEVMTMTSVTLQTIGIEEEMNTSGKYESVKSKLQVMDRTLQGK